jgi:hypothetical protein
MTTLAHLRINASYGDVGNSRADRRARLEGAVADAQSHVPPPSGWRRCFFARNRSAAGLIRRYRLWPAIEHVYGRITAEMGPVRIEVSAEDGFGFEFVMVVFLCDSLDFDRMINLNYQIGDECDEHLGKRALNRLVISVDPDPYASGDDPVRR